MASAQKTFERKQKEHAKLQEKERARLEVEAFDKELAALLSVHKTASPTFNWIKLLAALPPCAALTSDAIEFKKELDEWRRMRLLAKRVLNRDAEGYIEALTDHSGIGKVAGLGLSILFEVPDAKLVECDLKVNGRDIIPENVKSLTSTGKLSSKPMPKARFHEVYQDYICGCVLRVAREVLALLPVNMVIVTAKVSAMQSNTGKEADIAVLSAAMPRTVMDQLDFERLDPSDSMVNFDHRGDVIASRKSGSFVAIEPLSHKDVNCVEPAIRSVADLLIKVRELRAELSEGLKVANVSKSPTTADDLSDP